jgi:hypothetical protein
MMASFPKPGDNIWILDYLRLFLMQMLLMVLVATLIYLFRTQLPEGQFFSDMVTMAPGPHIVKRYIAEYPSAKEWKVMSYIYLEAILFQLLFLGYGVALAITNSNSSPVKELKRSSSSSFLLLIVCCIFLFPNLAIFIMPANPTSYTGFFGQNLTTSSALYSYLYFPLTLPVANAMLFSLLNVSGRA